MEQKRETHSSRRTQLQLVNTSPMGTRLLSGSGGYSRARRVGSSRAAEQLRQWSTSWYEKKAGLGKGETHTFQQLHELLDFRRADRRDMLIYVVSLLDLRAHPASLLPLVPPRLPPSIMSTELTFNQEQ